MRKNRLLTVLVFLILFSGCAGLEKDPPIKRYFDLNITPVLSGQNPSRHKMTAKGDAILVKELLIASTFDSHAFIYRTGKNIYQTDFYNEFTAYPARLITEKFTDNLYSSMYFSRPLTHRKQDIQYRLSGKILKLYGDFQTTGIPKAVMEIRLVLEKKQSDTFAAFFSKTYRFDEPIASPAPEDLAAGWSKELTGIVEQFISDYQSLN